MTVTKTIELQLLAVIDLLDIYTSFVNIHPLKDNLMNHLKGKCNMGEAKSEQSLETKHTHKHTHTQTHTHTNTHTHRDNTNTHTNTHTHRDNTNAQTTHTVRKRERTMSTKRSHSAESLMGKNEDIRRKWLT